MAHSASGSSLSSQFFHNTDGQEQHDQIAIVPKSPEPGLVLYMNFNQDQACFACGTENGFRIFNCDPFKETFRREFDGGSLLHPHLKGNPSPELDGSGIGIVEMLFMSNILALVGGGRNPRYSPNKVMIWDDHQSRCIGELLFRSEVRAVRLRRDRIVVVLEQKIYVYDFSNLKLLHQIETIANSRGLCAFSSSTNACVLACPGLRGGEVRIELYTAKKTKLVQAHDSPLACLALSQSGSLLATASTKGTIIRIFNTADGTKLQELRRGADRADVYSMTFSPNCQWFVLSSGKGTIHVFSLRLPWSSAGNVKSLDRSSSAPLGTKADASPGLGSGIFHAGSTLLSLANANTGSSLSFMKGVLPKYFSSEWSFAQFRLIENTRAIVAFGAQKNTIIIVCSNGSYYRCAFDPIQGGEMVQKEFARFLNSEVE